MPGRLSATSAARPASGRSHSPAPPGEYLWESDIDFLGRGETERTVPISGN
jgi:hypothetical protein